MLRVCAFCRIYLCKSAKDDAKDQAKECWTLHFRFFMLIRSRSRETYSLIKNNCREGPREV